MYELRITLDGDRIEMKAFLDAVSTFVHLLRTVDETVSRSRSVRWRLATLRYSSPAVVGCVGEPRSLNTPDQAPLVGRAVLSGLGQLERRVRPTAFSDEALDLAKHLADLKDRGGIQRVSIAEPHADQPATLTLTREIAAAVDDLIGAKYESLGSIIGRLELVSSHGGMLRCNIYEDASGKPVRCDFPETLKKAVLDAFDQRVHAAGTIKRDASGQPRHITLDSLEVLPTGAPRSASITGLAPDFTDGLDSADWLDNRWE